MNDPADNLNKNLDKELRVYYEASLKQMIKSFINKAPRDILIECLKEKKIIQQDWSAKGNKYKELKDGIS